MSNSLKSFIVDDSITYREILSNVISNMTDIDVIGICSNGKAALTQIRTTMPDIIFLDIDMPLLNGLDTLTRIKQSYPDIDVVMVSGISHENANVTVQALEQGALEFVSKPTSDSAANNLDELRFRLQPIVNLVQTRKNSRLARNSMLANQCDTTKLSSSPDKPDITPKQIHNRLPLSRKKPLRTRKIDVVAIGVSTGGPLALREIVPELDIARLPVPLLTVQHMPPVFTASLAERLNEMSSVKICEGRNGQLVENGHMYIAPGGRHMVVRKDRSGQVTINLLNTPAVNSCKPAVDVLFRSIAMIYGGNVLSVILTGMGCDGAAGVGVIRRKGGYSIIQDEQSSVVWGMPGAVSRSGEADETLSLNQISERIMYMVNRGFK